MRYDKLLLTLQKLMGFKPTQKSLAAILGINQAAISGRATRNSNFSDEELQKIENHYAIDLTRTEIIELKYYPNLFNGRGGETLIKFPSVCIPGYNPDNEYHAISNFGDSMFPTLLNTDKVIINSTPALTVIQDNKIYLFSYKGQIHLKRLVHSIDSVIIKSDSTPNKEIEIKDFENIKIMGYVVSMIREFN